MMTASSSSTELPVALSDDVVDLATRLADAAGSVIRRYYRTPFAVDDKPDSSPVTVADREAEAAIREILGRERPADGIIGEEHGTTNGNADWLWVIDPIDGTKSFITGRPTFGTLVALLYRGRPVLGVKKKKNKKMKKKKPKKKKKKKKKQKKKKEKEKRKRRKMKKRKE